MTRKEVRAIIWCSIYGKGGDMRKELESTDKLRRSVFKLNVDCFEDLFEWFSLAELLVLRQTCKRMKQVVDYYIKLNYPMAFTFLIRDSSSLNRLQSFDPNLFTWTKRIYFCSVKLTRLQVENIKYVLNHAESIQLEAVIIDGEFYEHFLKHCKNLRHLSIRKWSVSSVIMGTGNEWMLRHYPTIEHLELDIPTGDTINDNCVNLLRFFKLNRNIRFFSTSLGVFLANYNWMLESNLHLDRLIVRVDVNYHSICDETNLMHKPDFCKRLLIHYRSAYRYRLRLDVPKFRARALEMLYLCTDHERYFHKMSVMANITEIRMHCSYDIPNEVLNLMANNLVNLRRIYIEKGFLHHTRPFLCASEKVQQIIFKHILSNLDGINITDIAKLNAARKQIPNARKVTIFMEEETLLKLKWKWNINFRLIELKRSNSEACHLFE